MTLKQGARVPSPGHPPTDAGATPHPVHERRHELDWLRVGAVLGLIPFHVAVIFTTGSGDYIKNNQTSGWMDVFTSFISFWGIPLIFLLAGAGAWFALQFRSAGQFARERLLRLSIPLLFGVLAIVPFQAYLGSLDKPGSHQPFWAFYLDRLSMVGGFLFGGNIGAGTQVFSHLWFIPLLLGYSIITLPLFGKVKALHDRGQTARAAAQRRAPVYLLACGLALGPVYFVVTGAHPYLPALPNLSPLTYFFTFLVFYCFGFVLYALPGLTGVVVRTAPLALMVGAALWIGLRVAMLVSGIPTPTAPLPYLGYCLAQGAITWTWVIAIQGYGIRLLGFTSRLLRYFNKATYPAYVIHMAVLTALALPVVRWDLPWPVKLVFILVATLLATLAVYELLIRRIPPLRWLFGLKFQVTADD